MPNTKIEVVLECNTTVGKGPHWSKEKQELYFVDIVKENVHRYNPKTQEHYYVHFGGGPLTLVVPVKDEKDQFIIARGRELCAMKWDGVSEKPSEVKTIVTVQNEIPTNRFNGGKCDASGRLWIGTMAKESAPGVIDNPVGAMFTLEKNMQHRQHFSGVGVSNGVTWSMDNNIMYFIDTFTYLVEAFDFDLKNGNLTNRCTVFDLKANNIKGLPDGMTIDTNGNLWVTTYGGQQILHIDPKTCKLINSIKMPARDITSVMFGGPNLDILYVTTATRDANMKEDPKAGCLFQITGTGCRGIPAVDFSGKL